MLSDRMNSLYRYERYVYDLTRPLFLFGRDQMLRNVQIQPGQSVLEIGSGTARNLIKLAKNQKKARYFGVDVSEVMIEYSERKLKNKNLPIQVRLIPEELKNYGSLFSVQKFDHILLSFCLTMMEDSMPVLKAALDNLTPGGTLHIADFYDQAALPHSMQKVVLRMMRRYHVRPDLRPFQYLASLSGKLTVQPVFFRIGCSAQFVPN